MMDVEKVKSIKIKLADPLILLDFVPTPPGGRMTGSPDGRFIQARDANGNPTGVRIDGGHSPKTHTDPRALGPHGHVPGVTNADGTPWLPIK